MKIAKSSIAMVLLSAAAGFVAPAHATANQVVYQGPNDGQIKRGLGNLFVKNATPFCILFRRGEKILGITSYAKDALH